MNGVEVCRGRRGGRGPPLVDLSRGGPRRVDLTPVTRPTVWTNDLTHDYVHENSAYRT